MSHQLDVFYPWDVANTFSYISQKYQHFPTEKTKLWLFFFKQKSTGTNKNQAKARVYKFSRQKIQPKVEGLVFKWNISSFLAGP